MLYCPLLTPCFCSCLSVVMKSDVDCLVVLSPPDLFISFFFFFQAEDGIRDWSVTGVQTCALPICHRRAVGQRHAQRRGHQGLRARRRRERPHRVEPRAVLHPAWRGFLAVARASTDRSEEHTSELQSLTNLVCRLLLEKKKNKRNQHVHCGSSEANLLESPDRRASCGLDTGTTRRSSLAPIACL